MDDWWNDVEDAVLRCLDGRAPIAPVEIATRLGVSEDTAISLVSMLAREGRLEICSVRRA